jgi:hypothetical protein
MSFVVYLLVLVIAAGSVLFGLDWVSAPMSPMPASKYELHAAKEPVKAPPPVTAETKPEPKPETTPMPAPVQTAAKPEPAPTVAVAPAPIIVPEPVAAAPAPKCDIDACAAAYRSFTPEDCTYQPFDGPRQLCAKGTPPAAAAEATPPPSSPATATPDARAQATCNVSACSQAYISFSASDCTYRPLDGPRRICTK